MENNESNQNNSEKEIELGEYQFATFVNSMQNLAWMADRNGNIFWYNQRWYEYTGKSPEEMKEFGWESLHDPEKLPVVLERWEYALFSGQPIELVFPLKGADNKYRTFLTRVFPLHDKKGDIIRWVGTNTDIDQRETKIEKLEIKVPEDELRINTLLEYAPDAVIILDENGRILSCNPQSETVFEWKEKEVLGKQFLTLTNPEFYPEKNLEENKKTLSAFDGKEPMIIMVLKKNKIEFPIELKISSSPIKDQKFYICFAQKTSSGGLAKEKLKKRTFELLQANIDLLYSNQTHEHAEITAQFGSYRYDFHTEILNLSDNFYRILDFDPQEFPATAKNLKKLIYPNDQRSVFKTVTEVMNNKKISNWEYRMVSKKGKLKHIRATARLIRGIDNHSMIGVIQDITAEKAQQQMLIDANEELQKKNQEIAISIYNKRFLSEFSDRFGRKKTHLEFFDSLVLFIADLTHFDYVLIEKLEQKENGETYIRTIALCAFGKLVDNIAYPFPDGPCEHVIMGKANVYPKDVRKIFPKSQTVSHYNVEGYVGYPLFDEGENVIGLIAVMHQKEINDTDTISSIIKIVANRTEFEIGRIKQEETLKENNLKLEEKNKQLEMINLELKSFAYVSSHDLQEPLRKIQTFASLILKNEYSKLSVDGRDLVDRMSNAANDIQILIKDLLKFSRTISEEHELIKTDLNKILEEVKKEIKVDLEEKKATIEANDICEAKIIPYQFHQLMIQIIGNALKFSKPNAHPHIQIKSKIAKGNIFNNKELSPHKNYCHISVKDNSIGFEPHHNEKIFEVFQQLHNKGTYRGTGIGLAIAKKIVENHHGIITATGKMGKGATFDIYLPT